MARPLKTLLITSVAVVSCLGSVMTNPTVAQADRQDVGSLRFQAPIDLKVGTALSPAPLSQDRSYADFAASQFNSITPENEMKWETIHPAQTVYNFSPAETIVSFASAHGQMVRGHTLLWHSQNPAWVTQAAWTCEEARAVLQDHITTVVGHFRGEIYQWDVANEIFHDPWDQGGVRLRIDQNPFLRACAEDPVALIEDAFRWAHEADPGAVLFLNDYNVEGINAKSDAYYALAQQMLADGVPLGGFGLQAHLGLQYGFDTSLQDNMKRFDALGLQTSITEADVRMPTYGQDNPSEEQLAEQAARYGALLQACLDVPGCHSFTVWGFSDRYSWVPGTFAGQDWATITSRDGSLKPAYWTLLDLLTNATPGRSPRHDMGHWR